MAAAYAAGVVARSLAQAEEPPARAADLYRMLADVVVKWDAWNEIHHGRGLVCELPVNNQSASTAPAAPVGRRLYPTH